MMEEKQALGAMSTPMDPSLALVPHQDPSNNNNNNDGMSVAGSAVGSVASLASVFKSRYVQ